MESIYVARGFFFAPLIYSSSYIPIMWKRNKDAFSDTNHEYILYKIVLECYYKAKQ